MKLTPRSRAIAFAASAAIALALWLWLHDAQPNMLDIKAMTPFTQNMRTYCVGRFLIDAPADAKPDGTYGTQIASVAVKSLSSRTVTYQVESLRSELQKREAELRATPDGLQGRVFLGSYQTTPTSFVLHYRLPGESPNADGYVVRPGGTFFLSTNVFNDDHMHEFFDFIQGIESKLSIRRPDEIPTTPGFCIDNGLIAFNPPRGENVVGWAWDLPGHPDVRFGISTTTNDKDVKPGIVDREADDVRQLGMGVMSHIHTLRKRRFDLNGMPAQEWSVEITGEQPEYQLEIEIPGKPTDNAAPKIGISMSVGGQGAKGYEKPSLTTGEALALWDTVIQTLRPRPGAF